MNQAIKRGARVLVLTLAAALLLACAGCGKQAAQPDEYGLAAEKSKLDGVDIGNDLEIVSTGRYAGLFVEDGSDKTVSDVFCIRVKNTGSSDVQYAHITLSRGSESYEFDISTLPAGETLQALEVSGQTMPEKPAELTAAVTTYAPFTEPLYARGSVHGHDEREQHHRDEQLRQRCRAGLCLLQERERRPAPRRHHLPRGTDEPRRGREPQLLHEPL